MSFVRFDKAAQRLTQATIAAFIVYGLVQVIFPLAPLWIDEWLLVDNLKFKSSAQLWHTLDHTQQFPRVYLQCVKAFCAVLNYSYTSLRLPAFLAHCFGLAMLYRLSGRIFGARSPGQFVWIMLYISFNTSIHYFVLVKQYTMEMALGLVAIWQLLELISMEREMPAKRSYLLLCLSFAVCPFFSYTYPIAVAPVYLIIILQAVRARRMKLSIALPLILGACSTAVLYWIDVRHVLADQGMQDYWKDLMMQTFSLRQFFAGIYRLFCNMGAGDFFGNFFGVFGIIAFLVSSYNAARIPLPAASAQDIVLQYCCLLVLSAIGLFVAGKLPFGEFRLNAFAVPAIGFMLVNTFSRIGEQQKWRSVSVGVLLFFLLASAGNIFVTAAETGAAQHRKVIRIFGASGAALRKARQENLPVLVTPAIAYPFDGASIADWVLKTNPEFKVSHPVPVYILPVRDSALLMLRKVGQPSAIVLDGDSIWAIKQLSIGQVR